MNPITDRIRKGTVGELLVQLRLLEHGVQAAPPIKDSGNDLIAVRGEVFRAIQVKTRTGKYYSKDELPEMYHILAVVHLVGDENTLLLDKSQVFLIARDRVADAPTAFADLGEFAMSAGNVNALFAG
jgi:hypothetical protein